MRALLFLFVFATLAFANQYFDHSHSEFTKVLNKVVKMKDGGKYSQVNYKAVDKKILNSYISKCLEMKKSTVDAWPIPKQQAFYINLYNALTIQLVLTKYPVESIKDIGSGFFIKNPWKDKFFTLFGEKSHLDRIEHELFRGNKKLMDPLAHFAFNCASIGCPALLNEAFIFTKLNPQFVKATHNFLSDRSRNKVEGNTVKVSSIFKWYGEDFSKGFRGLKSLKGFFYRYRSYLADNPAQERILAEKKYDIEYLDYNWKLNDLTH